MRRRYLIIYISLAILLFALAVVAGMRGCGHEREPAGESAVRIDTLGTILTEIKLCSRLNVAEMKVHKVITHDDAAGLSGKIMGKEVSLRLPIGRRKVAIPMYATIKASIDMGRVTEKDIVRRGEKIEIFLPQPEVSITETHIDHEGIRQYVAVTRRNFSDEELLTYEKKGRDAIEKDIPRLGIREMAKESAARQIVPIVQLMGFKDTDITVSFRKDGKDNTITRKND